MHGFGRELLEPVMSAHPRATVTHVADLPPRAGKTADWPEWAPPHLLEALAERGIEKPWTHQAETAAHAWAGRHCVVATGTASGKSLGYLLPVLSELMADPAATALYLSPTKALGADQLAAAREIAVDAVRRGREGAVRGGAAGSAGAGAGAGHGEATVGPHPVAVASYDGDTPKDVRRAVREGARWIFTNPDMLHIGMLARHQWWARVLRKLEYVVVDECHAYRGVFGANVALVLRRLLRMARHYGANPTVVFASATTADPAAQAARLIGEPVAAVLDDGAPGAAHIAL